MRDTERVNLSDGRPRNLFPGSLPEGWEEGGKKQRSLVFALTRDRFVVRYYALFGGKISVKARSSGGERHPDAVDVQGSNPCVPTIFYNASLQSDSSHRLKKI